MSTGRMAKCVLPALPRLCSLAEQAKPQLFTSPLLNCHLLCNTAHREIDLARPKSNVKTSGFLPEERAARTPFVLCIPTRPLTTLGGGNGAAHTSGTSGGGSTISSVEFAEHVENFWKSLKPSRFGRHRSALDFTAC